MLQRKSFKIVVARSSDVFTFIQIFQAKMSAENFRYRSFEVILIEFPSRVGIRFQVCVRGFSCFSICISLTDCGCLRRDTHEYFLFFPFFYFTRRYFINQFKSISQNFVSNSILSGNQFLCGNTRESRELNLTRSLYPVCCTLCIFKKLFCSKRYALIGRRNYCLVGSSI